MWIDLVCAVTRALIFRRLSLTSCARSRVFIVGLLPMADTSINQPLIDETGTPEGYINLAEYDATMMEWPGIAIANIYTGAACVNALTTAVQNVVAKASGPKRQNVVAKT